MGIHAYLRDKLFPNTQKVDAYDPKFTGLHLFGGYKPRPQRLDPNFEANQNAVLPKHCHVHREYFQRREPHLLPAAMRRGPKPDGKLGWVERWEERMENDPEVQIFMQQREQQQQGGGGDAPAGSQHGSHRGCTRGRGGHGGVEGTRLPQLNEEDDFGSWAVGSQGAGRGQSSRGSGRGSTRHSTMHSTRHGTARSARARSVQSGRSEF